MTVGSWHVAVWSFLMASAHGAELMTLPFLLRLARPSAGSGHDAHASDVLRGMPHVPVTGVGVALVHTVGYLLMTGLIAVFVYERLGLRLLGRAWLNMDRLWAGALIATAALTPFIG